MKLAETNRIADALTLDAPATMKPEIFTFRVVGMTPLLHNNPASFIGVDQEADLSSGKKKYDDEEEARLRLYMDDEGNFYHPTEGFLKSMVRAVTGKKFGKLTATTATKGSVFMTEPFSILVNSKGKPLTNYTIDKRPVVVGKARVLRCRPKFEDWHVNLSLEIDTSILNESHVRDALGLAGRIVGIGDYRPQCGGGFGRYRVA